jgi:hypothetical protein
VLVCICRGVVPQTLACLGARSFREQDREDRRMQHLTNRLKPTAPDRISVSKLATAQPVLRECALNEIHGPTKLQPAGGVGPYALPTKTKKAESSGRYWEIIADNLSKAGWSWGCASALDSNARTI